MEGAVQLEMICPGRLDQRGICISHVILSASYPIDVRSTEIEVLLCGNLAMETITWQANKQRISIEVYLIYVCYNRHNSAGEPQRSLLHQFQHGKTLKKNCALNTP